MGTTPWCALPTRLWLTLAVGVVCTAMATDARAWECSRVLDNAGEAQGSALVWPSRQINFHFNADGTKKLDNAQAQAAVVQAFATWQDSTLRDGNTYCLGMDTGVPSQTDLQLVQSSDTTETFAGFNYFDPNNNHSTIFFRDVAWPYPLNQTNSTERMALTTVTYNKLDGTIVDADIEFNTLGYHFTVGDENVVWDLLNIATHEVGHFLGFDHTNVTDATMFNMAGFGETQKRTLSCDDAGILWFRYGAAQKTRSCGIGNLNDRCGHCAPAGVLSESPQVRLNRLDGGRGGCSCQALGPMDSAVLGLFLALCAWRRARRADTLFGPADR